MIKIAIILVHNKTDQDNFDQIEVLKSHLLKHTQTNIERDGEGKEVGSFDTYYYTISSLKINHEVRVFQVFPFGVTLPANKDDIDSHKVYYGAGDEDKTGDHPRFFNWGLKRGTDFGADVVMHMEDPRSFEPSQLEPQLSRLVNVNDRTEYIEQTFGKLSTFKMLKNVGQLNEGKSFTESISELKDRVVERGLKHG